MIRIQGHAENKKEPSHVCIIDEIQNLYLTHYSFNIVKTDVKQLLDKVFGLQFLHLDVKSIRMNNQMVAIHILIF